MKYLDDMACQGMKSFLLVRKKKQNKQYKFHIDVCICERDKR